MTGTSSNCMQDLSIRDLPATGWSRVRRLLIRALLLRCPQCGSRGIFEHPWSMRECCPRCGYEFVQEEGYFLGGYGLNLVVAEVIGVGIILVFLLRSDLSVLWQQIIAISAAILLPVLFYPFSRTLWMTLDLAGGDKDREQVRIDRLR